MVAGCPRVPGRRPVRAHRRGAPRLDRVHGQHLAKPDPGHHHHGLPDVPAVFRPALRPLPDARGADRSRDRGGIPPQNGADTLDQEQPPRHPGPRDLARRHHGGGPGDHPAQRATVRSARPPRAPDVGRDAVRQPRQARLRRPSRDPPVPSRSRPAARRFARSRHPDPVAARHAPRRGPRARTRPPSRRVADHRGQRRARRPRRVLLRFHAVRRRAGRRDPAGSALLGDHARPLVVHRRSALHRRFRGEEPSALHGARRPPARWRPM